MMWADSQTQSFNSRQIFARTRKGGTFWFTCDSEGCNPKATKSFSSVPEQIATHLPSLTSKSLRKHKVGIKSHLKYLTDTSTASPKTPPVNGSKRTRLKSERLELPLSRCLEKEGESRPPARLCPNGLLCVRRCPFAGRFTIPVTGLGLAAQDSRIDKVRSESQSPLQTLSSGNSADVCDSARKQRAERQSSNPVTEGGRRGGGLGVEE
jgi:hypothetical protein